MPRPYLNRCLLIIEMNKDFLEVSQPNSVNSVKLPYMEIGEGQCNDSYEFNWPNDSAGLNQLDNSDRFNRLDDSDGLNRLDVLEGLIRLFHT